MLNAFASVGVRAFDITFTNIKEDENGRQEVRGFRENQSLDTAGTSMPYLVNNAPKYQNNVIIRPHDPPGVLIVQLDDLARTQAEGVAPHAFVVICTSPGKDGTGNFQAWVAISDPPEGDAAKDFARRLRKGSGADATASGATRVAGSMNFKLKYSSLPAFPLIEITHDNRGKTSSRAELEQAGFVAPAEQSKPPLSLASVSRGAGRFTESGKHSRKRWPSYQMCLQGAPMTHGEDRPDVSRADFTWCRTAIEWGWSREATASRLMELSSKARDNESYAMLTASKAAESVQRQPHRLKSTLRHEI
jgi:hypothetical protein